MMKWAPRRLQSQLMLLTASALVVTIVLHAAYTLHEQTEISRGSIENQANAMARSLAIASTNPMVLGALDTLDELLERSADFPDVLELRIGDAKGRVLSHFRHDPDRGVKRVIDAISARLAPPVSTSPTFQSARIDGQGRMVVWYPVRAGSLLGWVRVDFSMAATENIRRRIWLSTLIVAAFSMVASSVLLLLFLRRPMRALERARKFAVTLGHSDGKLLMQIPAPIEIEDMETALNYASLSLHEQRQKLAANIESLQANEAVILDRTEQLNAIFILSPDGFVSFDRGNCVKYANPAFLRMSGFAESDILGLDEAAFSAQLAQGCVSPNLFPGVAALRGAQRLDPVDTPVDARPATRKLIELASPQQRFLDVGLRLSLATTVSQILYFRDVTHETEVDRLKSEFLATAAHELRTPMASIFGFSELLLMEDFDAATQREFLETIHNNSQLMANLINELLDLARIEARRGKDFKIEHLDAAVILQEIIAGFKAPAQRMSPILHLGVAPCWLRGDRGKLTQAVNNVLSNAYKYSPEGSSVEVTLLQSFDPARAGIRIVDQGIGMTQAQLERVGERFYRADTSGSVLGTGLGMSIVKEILQLHGGQVAIDSLPGLGTSVTLWLPAEDS